MKFIHVFLSEVNHFQLWFIYKSGLWISEITEKLLELDNFLDSKKSFLIIIYLYCLLWRYLVVD